MSFPYNKAATLGTACALTATSYAIILSRVALRRLRNDEFKIDDCLMLLAAVFYGLTTAACPIVVWNGRNIYAEDTRKLTEWHIQRIELGSKWAFIGRVFYMLFLWTLKACVLFYYTRLFSRTIELRVVKFAAVLVGVTWIACLLSLFLECRPFDMYWQVLEEIPGCANGITSGIILEAMNFITDLLIMVLPLPMILALELSTKRKIQISVIFINGLFVIAVSFLKLIFFLNDGAEGTDENKLIWSQIECFAVTVVVNAPIIYGLWRYGGDNLQRRKPMNALDTPKYDLNILRATTATATRNSSSDDEYQWNEGDQLHPKPESKVRDGIRRSIQRVSDKIRRSLELIEIERHTEIVQEHKAEDNSGGSSGQPRGMGTFFATGPIAHISTQISSNSASSSQKGRTKPNSWRKAKAKSAVTSVSDPK